MQEEARQARNATRMAAAPEKQADPTTVLALLREIEPGSAPRGWAPLALLRASSEAIHAASWSPDGKRIVAASGDKTIIVWGDIEPLRGADDPKLWTATTYCMPIDIRQRLLSFTDAQSHADLERCQRRVAEEAGLRP